MLNTIATKPAERSGADFNEKDDFDKKGA